MQFPTSATRHCSERLRAVTPTVDFPIAPVTFAHNVVFQDGSRAASGPQAGLDQGAVADNPAFFSTKVLITDLKQRGPLNDTLVVWGGGIWPGMTFGETDDYSYNVVRDPVDVHDLHATLLHCLGIDHTRLTFKFQGRHYRLTDVHGSVVKGVLAENSSRTRGEPRHRWPVLSSHRADTMPLVAPNVIEADRVCVRPLLESDLPALLAIIADEEVTRFLGHAPWKVMADAEAWFRRISLQRAAGSAVEFVIVGKQTGGVIGRCGLFDFEESNGHAAIGYILGRAHWRQGFMREALTVLIDYAFKGMKLRRLEAKIESPNTASAALLRRLGFTQEGVLRERWSTKEETVDAEVYGLLRHEWSPSRRQPHISPK